MILRNLPMDDYHADSAISNSKAKAFVSDGPWAYYRRYIAKDLPSEDSTAMAFGRAFDDRLFLSPDMFGFQYIRKPEGMSFSSTAGKLWKANYLGKTFIADDDWILMDEMMESIRANEVATDLLSQGEAQVSLRSERPDMGGVVVQSRPDWLSLVGCRHSGGMPYLVDLKTTSDLDAFNRNWQSFGYHRQLALGQALLAGEGIIADAFLLVAEKKRAPRCKVYKIPEHALAAGWQSFCRIATEIGERTRTGDWRDRQTEVEFVQLQGWQEKQINQEANA